MIHVPDQEWTESKPKGDHLSVLAIVTKPDESVLDKVEAGTSLRSRLVKRLAFRVILRFAKCHSSLCGTCERLIDPSPQVLARTSASGVAFFSSAPNLPPS
jgi:succinate dehydrogenase/fumarate reductase-like Fe-S protein